MLKLSDSRGKQSITLAFVAISWLVVVVKFALGGIGDVPVMSGTEFAAAVGAVLAIWLGREWTEKTKGGGNV